LPGLRGTDTFSINIRKQVWHCRSCDNGDAGGDVIDFMMHVDRVPFAEAVERLAGERLVPRRRPIASGSNAQDAESERHSALRIWASAKSIRATRAETYLAQVRGVDLDEILKLDDVLRFDPACPFGAERVTCLIALVRDVLTDRPIAIQRTALDAEGRKIERRSLGPTKSGAIKLWSDTEVTYGLVVGEGMETVAAAATRINPNNGTLLQPAWSLIDRINLRDLPILAGVESLTILVDNDASGDGQAAAAQCAARWSAAGREVIRLTPKVQGVDFNDIVRGERAS
jgi:hypothetical protein